MKISSFFKPLSFLPALAIMYMIYTFSAQPGETSASLSYKVSRKIVETVDFVSQQHWDDWQIDSYAQRIHGPVRKCAHITEYFLLAIAVSFPLYVYGVRGLLLMLLAGGICVAYACLDEYHQSMVAARSPSSRDVMIDSIGIFAGVILTRLIGWSGRMAITGPAYERRQKKQQKELDEREEMLRRREAALRREERRYHDETASARRSSRRYRNDRAAMPADDRSYHSDRAAMPADKRSYRSDRTAMPADERSYRGERPVSSAPQQRRMRDDRTASAESGQRVYRNDRSASVESGQRVYRDDYASASDAGKKAGDLSRSSRAAQNVSANRQNIPGDRTIVVGSEHEIDDRTRVYRTEEERRRMEEAYRKQVYERRRVQSQELKEDSTSDQLSDDLPFSNLFGKKKNTSR